MVPFVEKTQPTLIDRQIDQSRGPRLKFFRLLFALLAVPVMAYGQAPPPAATASAAAGTAPLVITLQDALARAKANDAQFRAAVTDLGVAHQDVVQSRAGLLPNASYNMEYIYTQGNGGVGVP